MRIRIYEYDFAGRRITGAQRYGTLAEFRAAASPGEEQPVSQPRPNGDGLVAIFRHADGSVSRCYEHDAASVACGI